VRDGAGMEIGPLHNSNTTVETSRGETAKKASQTSKKQRADTLELTSVSDREKLARLADEARDKYGITQTLIPDDDNVIDQDIRPGKIKLVQARIKSGFYDQPEIKEEIVRRLADEIDNDIQA